MCGYIAYFNGKQTSIFAPTSYAAQLKAIEFFKPAKSKRHLVHVALVQLADGTEYVHTATN